MAVTQADIDSLNSAIAEGTRQVTLGGQSIVYQTTESLIRARNDLQAQFDHATNRAAGTVRSKRTMLYYAGRGHN